MRRFLLLLMLIGAMSLNGGAAGADGITIDVSKKAQLAADGSVTYTVQVTCGPLPGTVDFTEGLAGAGQPRTGASAEGGLSPNIVCDGIALTYTAGISLLSEDPFKRGRATAFVSVIACNTVGDQQVCVQGSARERVIVTGP